MSIGRVTSATGMYNVNSSLLKAAQQEKKDALQEQIKSSDADKNGTLNKDEFVAMSKETGGELQNIEKLSEALFGMFDQDSDGELTEEEIQRGRDSLVGQLGEQHGSLDTMTQVNAILNSTQTTLIDLMGSSNKGDDSNNDPFGFLNSNYRDKINEYLAQDKITQSGDYSTASINALLNSTGSLSDFIM